MTLKERIKKLSDEQNISLPALESELGFGNGTIVKWDKSIPNADKLNKVANYFNVSMDYLLNGERNLLPSIELNNPHNIINTIITNLTDYLKKNPIKYKSEILDLDYICNSQDEKLNLFLQDTIGLSIKELNSLLNGNHIPTPQELVNISDGLDIPIEALLSLPYPPSYQNAKSAFVHAICFAENCALPYVHPKDDNSVIINKNGCAFEVDTISYDTFISSIDDYISLNLKNLILNGKRNSKFDLDL